MTQTLNITANIHHATRAKAERLASLLAAEYPVLTLDAQTEDGKLLGWIVIYDVDGELGDTQTVMEVAKVPEIADIMEALDALGLDAEAIEAEEEDRGSVVPQKYRVEYREQANTHGQSCGDWLAVWLETATHGIEGFDRESFAAILVANAVDQSGKWAKLPESGQNGWVGRWRMNGRQKLEQTVALTGQLVDATGAAQAIPEAFLDSLRGKHAVAIAKAEKAAAKLAA